MMRFPNPHPDPSSAPSVEPLHSLEPQEASAELGSSLEVALFGGKIQPTNLDAACAEGLLWFEWVEDEVERGYWGVEMGWVERLWRGEEGVVGGKVGVVGEAVRLPFSEAEGRRRRGR